MADRLVAERLQPSLLDRLTDEEPTALKESRAKRVIDINRLREIIQRDLAWLLNTINMGSDLDPEKYPNVFASVLNYGLTPMAGDASTSVKIAAIRNSIARSIEIFEPRIIQGTTKVELMQDFDKRAMFVFFEIRSDMWAQPLPLELYLRSRVDLSTGDVEMDRVA